MPKLSMLLAGFGCVDPNDDIVVSGLAIDSRQVGHGDLFLACSGAEHHGLDFIEDVLLKRPAAVVWEPGGEYVDVESLPRNELVPYIAVPNLSQHLAKIASRFYGNPSADLMTVGITGTDGKTSCSHFVAQALTALNDFPCGVLGTLGYGMYGALVPGSRTTPNAVELQSVLADVKEIGAKQVVMEVSSHALDQGRVDEVSYDIAVLTNLSRDHLDYHQTVEAYGDAKRKLFHKEGLKLRVINIDDEFGRSVFEECADKPCLTYGFSDDAQVKGSHLQLTSNGVSFWVETPFGKGRVESRLLGDFNAKNLMAVIGVLLGMGVSLEAALHSIQSICPVDGRMERLGGDASPMVVVDYAHTPNALEQVLKALRPYALGRLVCVFGCGGERDKGKRPIMGEIAYELSDHVVVTSDNPRSESPIGIIDEILEGCPDLSKVDVEVDRASAIEWAITNAEPGDVVLIAGKGHETYQQVNGRELPFDDRSEVKKVLRGGGNC